MGPKLGTAKKMMCSKAVLEGLFPQECNMRRGCGYPQSPDQDELKEAMDKITTCQEAHSTGQGGVESVHAVTRHSRATTIHAQQASTAIKQEGLEKACDKLIGPRRSAREIKKGHGSTINDYSVVLPTRVLAQSQGHTSAIDARNSLHDQAKV